jgi:demethylmacrocin O-methyltransferase
MVWALWRLRGIQSRLPPAVAAPFGRGLENACSRSPSALAILYDIDKGPERHDYADRYRSFLRPFRSEAITLLEIGILKGGSLRLWRRFLPKARIVGIDLELPDLDLPGVEMHRGDQSDEEFLESLISRYGGFDVVIDDGSHVGTHVRTSFRVLFPALRPGGWYVIEDLETSYWESHEGGPPGSPGTAVDLVKSLVDRTQIDSGDRDIAELHIFEGIAFVRKAS